MKCEKLEVWKISARLSAEVYKGLSQCKDFGFRDQITRSCLSIPSNIAEGMEKDSLKENIKFLDIAKGSAAEFVTQVYIGMDIEYISKENGQEWVSTGEQILGMLTNLQKSLKARIRNT
ncbi:four helix bundle protein [Prosthecochloris sp. CIB 2401]|uniref:four helix bundle protein n=1 Tax=Prosthecochloris sp. CIB 2401 TaxID=1868325 RepID=UPI00080AB855|nr:four helix bundle protein [Prosthecochloris sp. CIB 2401]ANT64590.1 four helix bundle protein [Prosthecochloris sp. CIB 2401]